MRRRRPAPTSRRTSERGAAAVEFALVVPFLVTLLLGTVTVGLTYTQWIGTTNAVREGVRFGATADASPLVAGQWADDVIKQVRDTQFDDPSAETVVCVQLWQVTGVGTGVAVPGTSKCSPAGSPLLAAPVTAASTPKVPTGVTGCVVRVIAARPYTVNIGVASWDRVSFANAVVRYERKDKVATCE